MRIWLDDERKPPDIDWIWCDNAQTVVELLSNFKVQEMSLDHDLGDEDVYGTGYDVLLWVEQKVFHDESYVPPLIYIHTQNPVAMKKMIAATNAIQRKIRTDRR